MLLQGWPYDIHSYADVAPSLASAGYRVIVPYVRGCGTTRFLSSSTVRNGQPAASAVDTIALMDALKIGKAIVAGFDWGGRTACIMGALWPERCKALVSVSGYLLADREANKMPLPPKAEYQWWYQYYFATERGALGYDKYRHDFGKLIWQIASPSWKFDDATFDRTAASFDNPDYAAILIHNYRYRLGLADGEPQYDTFENRLAENPVITVPTITLEGDANGAPHAEASAYAKKFSGRYAHRIITAASVTICRRKLRRPSLRPSSTSTGFDPRVRECPIAAICHCRVVRRFLGRVAEDASRRERRVPPGSAHRRRARRGSASS